MLKMRKLPLNSVINQILQIGMYMILLAVISGPVFGEGKTSQPAHLQGACLAGICLDGKAPSEAAIIKRFGRGQLANTGLVQCYSSKRESTFLAIGYDDHSEKNRDVAWVYAGRSPWGEHTASGCNASQPLTDQGLENLSTGEGLKIGDSESQAQQLYKNMPNEKTQPQDDGSKVVSFSPDKMSELLETEISLKDGKVWSIMVGIEE